MRNRDTRVQAIVIWNGKYILVKQTARNEERFFWGLPGGGKLEHETEEEGAIREIEEETGLKVDLLPIKIESKPQKENSPYRRIITFAAFPVEGTAKIGFDPEPESEREFDLTDIRWQDFYSNDGIDDIVKSQVEPFREKLKAFPL